MGLHETEESNLKSKIETFGSFFIGPVEVALNIRSIQEVVNFPERIIKMPLAPEFLVGVFNLRGLIIPIINLKSLLKFEDAEISSTQKIGIVDHEGAKVGLLFDSTSEILRVSENEMNTFGYSAEHSHRVVSGAIKLDSGNRILQIIDPFALVSIENIPQIIDQQSKSRAGGIHSRYQHESRKKCISFSVSDIKMGFEITGIHEIIKVPEIQSSVIQNELCLGIVNLRGQTVPVIDLAMLLGAKKSSEANVDDRRIIILKLEHALFGLLVDSVECINTYLTDDVMLIPLLSQHRSKMFLGCILQPDASEIILLNYQEVLTHSEIADITQGHSKIYGAGLKDQAISKRKLNRQAYISFRLDHLFGVSIKDIREIINYSDEIIAAPGMPDFVKGVLNLRGKLVTIVDARSLYEIDKIGGENNDSKILIFESDEERFGLIVDSVESIVTVDEDKKMQVPSLMVQKARDRFENDIKEIISFQQSENREGVLIILNMEPVTSRIKKSLAA